jgi:hypothetical protein
MSFYFLKNLVSSIWIDLCRPGKIRENKIRREGLANWCCGTNSNAVLGCKPYLLFDFVSYILFFFR